MPIPQPKAPAPSPPPPPRHLPDPAVPAWLRGLPRAPEYRPTESEFADPIAFLSRIERDAAAYGICKVIPPYPRPSRRFAFSQLNRSLRRSSDGQPSRTSSDSSDAAAASDAAAVATAIFTTRHQEVGTSRRAKPQQVLKQVWQSGEFYTLDQFEAKSRAFSRANLGGLRDPSPLAVEALFWKAADDRPIYVEYANDVPGSGFAAPAGRVKKRKREVLAEEGEKGAGTAGSKLSRSPWNLQAIARAPGSLTRFMPDDVPGVTSPMVYIGMLFSWFAWHVEDHELHSLNFLHTGAPKTWYAVPGNRASDFEDVIRVRGYGGDADCLSSLAMLGEKTTLMSPEVLVACGIPCCRLVQYPGEFVVTFPRAYHVGFSHGFNCGEAANFATPQWLYFARDAAVRRAAMNYLPMLSHQQLLYLLAVSFISRTPRELLSGVRTSRLRDRRKEETELLVKKSFLQDMIVESNFLCTLLEKKSTIGAVLWEPDLLPSPCTGLHSCTSGLKAPERKADNSRRMEKICEENSLSDGTISPTDGCSERISTDSRKFEAAFVSEEEKTDDIHVDEDDLPFDLSIDSGSLTCVACGILGYPVMAILQPSRKALEEISRVNREDFCRYSGKENCSNESSCSLEEKNSGCPCTSKESSSSPVKVPHLVSVTEEQDNSSHRNRVASCGTKGYTYKVSLMEHELGQSRRQNDSSSLSCSKGELIGEATKKKISCSTRVGSEFNKQADSSVDAQVVEFVDADMNWNTSLFARPRIFCLQHALEVEELLQRKGGAHVLVICHSDYLKVKALAISIAEEIGFHFDCKDAPLATASKSDLHLINISIDDEGQDEDGIDWTSQLGLNLKYCVKLRKEASRNQEQLSLPLGGLFSDHARVSLVPNLKWLCRKARTPYKIVGCVSPWSGLNESTENIKPAVMKRKIGTDRKVYESCKRRRISKHCSLIGESGPKESDAMVYMHKVCEEKNDCDGGYLLDIPIALAEYPLKHHVSGGMTTVSRSQEYVCSTNSQDASSVYVEFNREQGAQSAKLSSSATVSAQLLCDNEKITEEETNLNCISNYKNLHSQNNTLKHVDVSLQVQQDQKSMEFANNTSTKFVGPCLIPDLNVLENTQKALVATTPENEGNCVRTSNYSYSLGTEKSAIADEPEAQILGDACVTPEFQFTSNVMSMCDRATVSENVQDTLTAAIDGKCANLRSNSSGILLDVLARDSKVDDGSGADAANGVSLTSMGLARHDASADDVGPQAEVAEIAGSSGDAISDEDQSISFNMVVDNLQVIQNSEILQEQLADTEKVDASTIQFFREDTRIANSSVNPVAAGSKDVYTNGPKDLCISDIVARSIGKSQRRDIICYVRRKGKRGRESEPKVLPQQLASTEEVESSTIQFFKDNMRIVDSSVNPVATCSKDEYTDGPKDLSVSDVVARSIGNSRRTGIICCVRRKGKRGREPEPEVFQEKLANTEEVGTSTIQFFKDNTRIVSSSVNPVAASSKDGYTDGPNDLRASDIVPRSIGNSQKTDVICYVRRKRKREKESGLKIDSSHSGRGSFLRGPCEGLRPRTRPAIDGNITRKRKFVDDSLAKAKRRKKGPYECDIDSCHMTFESVAELDSHKRNMCTVESCGKCFSSHQYLKRHQCVHSDERPFKCPWKGCKMTFESVAELDSHKRNMCTVESCGKCFSSHQYLKRHQCVHSDERPFKCPWKGCQMTFKWLWAQTEHVRVHTGERPYKCMAPGCGQRFMYVSDFSRHRKKFNHHRCQPQEEVQSS